MRFVQKEKVHLAVKLWFWGEMEDLLRLSLGNVENMRLCICGCIKHVSEAGQSLLGLASW